MRDIVRKYAAMLGTKHPNLGDTSSKIKTSHMELKQTLTVCFAQHNQAISVSK